MTRLYVGDGRQGNCDNTIGFLTSFIALVRAINFIVPLTDKLGKQASQRDGCKNL